MHSLDGIKRQGSKGKEVERTVDAALKQNRSATYPPQSSSSLEDMTGQQQQQQQQVHVHHHHHYYYQSPPLIQSNTDDAAEQHYNSIVNRLRPESVPIITTAAAAAAGDAYPRRSSLMDSDFSISPTDLSRTFPPGTTLDDEPIQHPVKPPIVNKKRRSILGAMDSTFYRKDGGGRGPYDSAGATIRAKRYAGRPTLLEGLSDDEDEDFDFFGEPIHPLGTSADSNGNGNAGMGASGHHAQRREKFLERLKKFLMRPPPPFAKNSAVAVQDSALTPSSVPTTPTHYPVGAAATVRVGKSRWSRGFSAGLFGSPPPPQDMDLESDRHSSSEGQALFGHYPPRPQQHQQRASTVRRWMHQDSVEPFVPTLQRRDRIDIRTQFQQSSPTAAQDPQQSQQGQHFHHHHHHHHHDMNSSQDHTRSNGHHRTHHRHNSHNIFVAPKQTHQRKQSLPFPLEKRPFQPSFPMPDHLSTTSPTTPTTPTAAAPMTTLHPGSHRTTTATSTITPTIVADVRSSTTTPHRSPKSMATSVGSSIPIASPTALEEEDEEEGQQGRGQEPRTADHDTPTTTRV
ncbi:hypothetical protein BGX31_002800 [Mortierella sp. GBA43]|nr:hypothetical protein BGX31_002800 [Mortierella sp. GBA43]